MKKIINLNIKKFTKSDLKKVIRFIQKSDFTSRTRQTWEDNKMTAIIAFLNNKVIGIIPFEILEIKFKNHYIKSLWISAAFIKLKFRNIGLGTLLNNKIKNFFYPKYKTIFVMRSDEGAKAYKWYIKNNYKVISKIISFQKKINSKKYIDNYKVFKSRVSVKKISNDLYNCFNQHYKDHEGYPKRRRNYWENKFQSHYYKSYYKYYILANYEKNKLQNYAFLGKTRMKDNISRFDILELCVDNKLLNHNKIYESISHFAILHDTNILRIQFAIKDKHLKLAKKIGFVKRWETNLLAKTINSNSKVQLDRCKFFQADYI